MGLREILFGKNTDNEEVNEQEEIKEEVQEEVKKAEDIKVEENTKTDVNTEKSDEVTTDMLVGEIISKHPSTAQFLMDCGMEYIFCPASQMESLGEACAVHGIDADEICAAINEKLSAYKE